jgi:hypothetical protein
MVIRKPSTVFLLRATIAVASLIPGAGTRNHPNLRGILRASVDGGRKRSYG